jgi:hypothetical protein
MWKFYASHVSMNDRLFEYSEIIDWWEAERLAASQACFGLQETLFERVKQESENVSSHHLLMEESDERKNLEASIFREIHKLDKKFLMATVKGIGQDPGPSGQGANVSQYAGWSFWDIGKLIVGGGSAGSAAIAGSRVAPAALAAVGLGALAAPMTIAAGLAGLAWSAYSVSGQKRSEYLQALNAGISQKLTAIDDPEKSVLSRQLARLDALRHIRLEPFL